jgi:hypothetical protein
MRLEGRPPPVPFEFCSSPFQIERLPLVRPCTIVLPDRLVRGGLSMFRKTVHPLDLLLAVPAAVVPGAAIFLLAGTDPMAASRFSDGPCVFAGSRLHDAACRRWNDRLCGLVFQAELVNKSDAASVGGLVTVNPEVARVIAGGR